MDAPAFRSILVPLDGSASADGALRLALQLVARDGEVIVAHVIDRNAIIAECITPYGGDAGPALAAQESNEREIFGRAAESARAAGIRFATASLDGTAVPAIASLALSSNVDAIAMGTHARSGLARLVLGNTAAGVMRKAGVPVFVVHEHDVQTCAAPLKTIVVALDASPAASVAARAAVDLAAASNGRVIFAHVALPADDAAQTAAFAAAAAYALAAGVPSDSVVLQGEPVYAIINSVKTCHANLITVGAQGRIEKPFGFGSIAQAVVRTSPVPVLVIPAPSAANA